MDPVHALAERVLAARAARHPAWATQVGLPRDHEVRRSGARAFEAEAREVAGFLDECEALPKGYARDALATQLRLELFELREVRTWARNPDLATEYFDHLFSLLLAPHLDDEARALALASRLEACATFFEEAWPRFDPADVPVLWVDGALESAEAAPAFFEAVRAAAALASSGARRRVEAALPRAEATLARHAAWLAELRPRARGATALGRARFASLLGLRHIPDAPDALVSLGERLVARFGAEMREAALTVLAEAGREPGDDPVAEALAVVRADHPATFADVLRYHEECIRDARAFVESRGLMGVPDVPLVVVETPAFLRHLVPFAAYSGPARFATPRRGTYLVTPKADLSAFARADVRNTTVHEAYPGHHLQISVAAERAPLAAFLCEVPDLTEGWALYCEWLAGEHGFAASPGERLVRAKDALWRAVRIVLDVGLHAGDLSPADAAERLAREVGMTREEADAEVLRYTQTPAYNLSYMWGRLQVEALRRRLEARGVQERAFHDALLSVGSAPVVLVAAEVERLLAR